MTSGIYRFEFVDGSFYFGKSENIEKRWKQHSDNMRKGKHTKAIQEAYGRWGLPKFEVWYTAHEDHIDILESFFINSHWGNPKLLNATKPTPLLQREEHLMNTIPDAVWKQSTFEHIERWSNALDEKEELQKKLNELLDGTMEKKLLEELGDLEVEHDALIDEYNKLKHRGFFARLFNLGV